MPLDNSKTMASWDLSAVIARLHHLREKGSYVKELVVEDRKAAANEPDVLLSKSGKSSAVKCSQVNAEKWDFSQVS